MLPRTRSSITGLAAQIRLILASHAPAAGSGGAAADRHAFRETRSGRPGRSSRGSRVAHQPEDHCESAIDRAILREVCRRVHSAAGVTRLQDCADYVVSREINHTIYRAFITDRSSCTRLFKGAHSFPIRGSRETPVTSVATGENTSGSATCCRTDRFLAATTRLGST